MQIEKLELENWMSYPRRWQTEDGEQIPIIDLANEPLTLVAGENGAGKSAILEAICYALFAKYPRGNSNSDAIRSGERKAKLRLFFTLPGTEERTNYCIERELATSSSNATLYRLEPDGKKLLLAERQQAVTGYIQDELLRGVSYDTFVSSVFLRQQEAGKFMELSPGDQRQQLLSLCRLEIYDQIQAKATELRRQAEHYAKNLQDQFDRVSGATNECLAAKKDEVAQLEQDLDRVRTEREAAQDTLNKVRQIAKLAYEIERQKEKLSDWQELLKRKDEIEFAVGWCQVWRGVGQYIENGQRLLADLSERKTKISSTDQQVNELKSQLSQLKTEHETIAERLAQLRALVNEKQEYLLRLTKKQGELDTQQSALRSAKHLDETITRHQLAQNERARQLEHFDNVHKQSELFTQLQQSQAILSQLLESLENAEQLESETNNKEQSIAVLQKQTRLLEDNLEPQLLERNRLSAELDKLRFKKQEIEKEKGVLVQTLDERQRVLNQGRCPTCGLELTGEIGDHVHAEATNLQAQVTELTEQIEAKQREEEAVNQQLESLKDAISSLEQRISVQQDELKQVVYGVEQQRKQVVDSRLRARQQWQSHLARWSNDLKPGWLSALSRETLARVGVDLNELKDVIPEFNRLIAVKGAYETTESTLKSQLEQRAAITVVSPITDEQIATLQDSLQVLEDKIAADESECKSLQNSIRDLEAKEKESSRRMQETERQLSNANSHLQQLQTYQEVESGQLEYIRNHLSREGKRMATDFPEFAHALLPAIEDSTIFTRLQKTAEDYATKAQQISQLQLAEREAHGVQVLVNKLEADLVSLREFTRGITIDDAQDRFDTFSSASKQLETDLSREQVELGQLKEQHEERQRLKPLLQKVKQQCWAYGEIEKALARGGKRKPAGALITQISNTLMQGIAQEATKILEELKWHIAVQYHATNGFEVEDQSAAVRRRYQEFSGGERFAISIAVALAASAATNKTSSIRCLFIDEGFGALDERHRKRIVNDAIGRLISRGLRDQVVVITHIQDMQEYFPNRIELRREDGQSVLVTGDQTLP